MRSTINRYILNEIWPTFLVCLFVSVFIILATKMLSITEMIVNRGVYLGDVNRMIAFLLPDILAFALPAATLMAVVVAFLRLSADNEIIALKSSGISIYQMLMPVLAIAFSGLILSLFLGMIAVPWGNSSFKDLLFKIAQSQANMGVKERIFSEPFRDVVFYVNSFSSKERRMKDVFVVDRRDRDITYTIVSKEGNLVPVPGRKMINLHFIDGTIFMVDREKKSARSIQFASYDLNINLEDIMEALAGRQRAPKEMTLRELSGHIRKSTDRGIRYNEMMIEFVEKLSIPVAVFLMAIIGVPLGAQMKSRGRSAGVGLSLGVFLLYYLSLAGARSICETGMIHPMIGIWLPDLLLAAACMWLLKMASLERSTDLFSAVRRFYRG